MNKKPNRLVKAAKAALRFLGFNGQLSFSPDVLQSLQSTASGKFVTVDSALQLSAVFACVRLVSETVSTLPLKLYKSNADGSSSLARTHPLYNVLCSSPNYEMTQSRFLLFIVASIVLWGNSYTEIIRSPNGKRIISLDPLLPQNMQVIRNKVSGALEYFHTDEGVRRQIDEKNIMHIRSFGIDGVMGIYTIGKGRETFGTAISAEQTAAKFFENGLQTSGFLSTDKTNTPEQRQQLKKNIESFMGSKNAGKVMVLENGYSYNGITMNPEAAQMLETRSFEIEEICRWFRVPPFMIGHFDKQSSWSSSAEAQDLNFLKYSLRPLLVNIEQEISRCLIGRAESEIYFASFNIEGLLRADSATRSEYYASAANNGWMSRNEIRAKENLPPIPGGDTYTVQSALISLDEVGKNYEGGNTDG